MCTGAPPTASGALSLPMPVRPSTAASGVPSRSLVCMLPPRALPHRFKGSAEGVVVRYLSPLAREPPCWVEQSVYGVGMEVERKFLVSEPPDLGGTDSDEIEQGYLATGSDGEVRLRRKGEKLLLTAKRGSGLSRQEAEVEIDQESFDELWSLTEGRWLKKRRHVVPYGQHKIEVDVYGGELEGLIVAEIEFV